jgi:hypothetical protein
MKERNLNLHVQTFPYSLPLRMRMQRQIPRRDTQTGMLERTAADQGNERLTSAITNTQEGVQERSRSIALLVSDCVLR